MAEFKCSICNYKSLYKTSVKTHINNENIKCFKENPIIVEIPVEIFMLDM